MNWAKFNRKSHYWLSLAVAVPLLIVIVSGILLQLKKDSDWVQPPAQKSPSKGTDPAVTMAEILAACQGVEETQVKTWDDIDRVDIRPSKGLIKVTTKDSWEIQLDHRTGERLQVAYRRSDLIESIHDGSWFHDSAKLWIFLPAAVILLVMWLTGMYLFVLPYWVRARRKRKKLDSPDGPA